MLLSVTIPGGKPVPLKHGLTSLWGGQAIVPTAVGFGVFDTPASTLPASGLVEIELVAPLDGRRYVVKRALDVPEHWRPTREVMTSRSNSIRSG